MSDAAVGTSRVVQFVHPGFEYQARRYLGPTTRPSGVMSWKEGRSRHDRKFLVSPGSIYEPSTAQEHDDVPICFWGEWEGPSLYWRLASRGKPHPSVAHVPFRPAERPASPVQNTDPMVFGDAFVYSNCLQGTYRALRTLSRGSIVLFGRFSKEGGRPAFGLDTCLVVDEMRRLPPLPFEAGEYGIDLLEDVVLKPLHTEGAREDLTVFFGRRRDAGASGPFSFFPARRLPDNGSVPAFARPELRPIGALEGVISSGNMQGIKVTSHEAAGRDAIWAEVVRQVVEQGCGLGHHAATPPLLGDAEALRRSECSYGVSCRWMTTTEAAQ